MTDKRDLPPGAGILLALIFGVAFWTIVGIFIYFSI